jgi:hypothetical protein
VQGSLQKVNFTAQYCWKEQLTIDELEEFFKLPQEDFDSCDLLHWWMGRKAQFPNLFCLAHNIFSIPGELIGLLKFQST